MEKTNVLIIGAGAAGLMAAYQLTKAGEKVTILEARNHAGGRVHTLNNEQFFQHAELGAEFIHGDLPVTFQLLKEAGIAYEKVDSEMWQYHNGEFKKDDEFVEGWDLLLEQLNNLQQDMPIANFLEKEFPGDKYGALRDGVLKFVSGYDTADPYKASAFALRKEWGSHDEDAQYRIAGGYAALLQYLINVCKDGGNNMILNTIVQEICWKHGDVKVVTTDNVIYEAQKVIIALPLGVLMADKHSEAAVSFHPGIPQRQEAIGKLGFGAIIKILLEFDEPFWESDTVQKLAGNSLKGIGFLFTDEAIPTWWTQLPQYTGMLTGWLGGPAAYDKREQSPEELLELVLTSLSNVFKIEATELKNKLIAWHIANWTADPFTRGTYAYDTVDSPAARKIVQQPVEGTLFFAGEYLYEGPAMGTVEAAFTSGKQVAQNILSS
ncbi:MAG: FAD-dependent oxidoreductase [Sphingobacteriales bacterium]|nr:MAG: FAD-dependent oxidoreductase [Sphingobacteriales bacterium]